VVVASVAPTERAMQRSGRALCDKHEEQVENRLVVVAREIWFCAGRRWGRAYRLADLTHQTRAVWWVFRPAG